MRALVSLALAFLASGCASSAPPADSPVAPPPVECAPGRVARGGTCVAIDEDCRPGEKLEFGVGCVREGAAPGLVGPHGRETETSPGFPEGVGVEDIKVGSGPAAKPGMKVTVHYTGTLADGTRFDSSLERGQPFVFDLGKRMVIKGWEAGLVGMRVGGRRKLTLAPAMAYGDRGAPPRIPPGSTLVFVIDLLGVQ